MQDIIVYLRADGVKATVVDNYGTATPNPYVARGTQCNLCLRFIYKADTPYVLSELSPYVSWKFVMDKDWLTATTVLVLVDSGITVSEVTENAGEDDEITYSQIKIPLTELNTAELIAALENSESLSLGAELAGYEAGITKPGFLKQFNVTVLNRRDTDGTGTPEPVDDGLYSAAQVDALLAAKADKLSADDYEITDAAKGVILPDANGVRWRLTVDTDGNPVTSPIA